LTFIVVAALLTACLSSGQQPPAFEVAAIKISAPNSPPPGDDRRNMDPVPGQFAMRNVNLLFALVWAYDLRDYQITGPNWITENRYDIVARAPGASNDQMKLMLRTLLTERFQLALHRETRQLPVYLLTTLGKGPPKVKEPNPEGEHGLSGTSTGTLFHKEPIERLCFLLSRRMDRPVLDRTGLAGIYDYVVDTSGLARFITNIGTDPNDIAKLKAAQDASTPIFEAVQRDLGLKLEAQKADLEVLVIDKGNKVPAEN
jgi:uncharacterized protein (TIGR03435 family)